MSFRARTKTDLDSLASLSTHVHLRRNPLSEKIGQIEATRPELTRQPAAPMEPSSNALTPLLPNERR